MKILKALRDNLVDFFEKADLRLLIFILLSLNFLSFTLSSNEEAYLPLARQFTDPAWIPDSFTFTEWPGSRLLFQWITGWTLKILTFEQVAFWGRMVTFLFIAIPAGNLFKKLRIGNLAAILLLQLYLIKQNYFAGEFIFGDYEAKSLAYIMVLSGVNCLLDKKYMMAVLWAVIASCFHILVGGWFFLLALLFTFFSLKSFVIPLRQLLLFSILIAPFLFYLARQVYTDGSLIQGINIDRVYVFFRNPHHTAPLSIKTHLFRTTFHIGITGILFVLSLFLFRRLKDPACRDLYLLNIIILTILFISLGISFIDHNGTFLKYYLFRLAALGLLFMYLNIYKWAAATWRWPVGVQLCLMFLGFYLIVAASVKTIREFNDPKLNPDFEQLVDYVSKETDPAAVFITLKDYDLSFSRRTQREVFVNYKFDPGGGKKIYEWYRRIGERKKLADSIGYLEQMLKQYKLDFVLSDIPLSSYGRLKTVFCNPDYYLYKIQ